MRELPRPWVFLKEIPDVAIKHDGHEGNFISKGAKILVEDSEISVCGR
ncbi:hypothetical protein PYV50_20815 [Pseudomonas sp. H22_DOA]|nr:hypothetical protein PYV50_20815 [Pseudomonas sp. H22_DOA]